MDKLTEKIPLMVLGDFAWDVMVRTNSSLAPGGDVFGEIMFAAGGSAANAAVWATRCGLKAFFIGKIGRDRFGRLAKENLDWEKVDNHLIYTDEHRTAAVAVWIDDLGQRSMVSGQGADFYLLSSELPRQILRRAGHLHLTAWSLFTDPPRTAAQLAAQIVKEAGGTISLDPASFQMIEKIGREKCIEYFQQLKPDIFFPNLEEGQFLSGKQEPRQIAQELSSIFPGAIIALKLDASGALILTSKETRAIAPVTETIIDATGAGDSFAGAFLAKWLCGKDFLESAGFAVAVSAWVVNHISARPHSDKRLEKILKEFQ